MTRLPTDKLKAVIPPFLPPSNFEPWNSDRSRHLRDGKSEAPRLPMPPQRKLNSSGNSDIVSLWLSGRSIVLPRPQLNLVFLLSPLSHFKCQTSISRVVSRSIKFPGIAKGPSSSSPSNSGHYHSPHSSGGSSGVAGITQNSHNRSGLNKLRWMPSYPEKSSRIIYTDGFVPLGGSADSVLSQIAAQRKRAAGLIDVKPHTPEKTQTQSQPSVTPSAPTLTLPDISLPDIHSHPSLVASDVHSRRVCAPSPTFNLSRHAR